MADKKKEPVKSEWYKMFGEKPKKVDGQFASRTAFYKRLIKQIIKGCIDLKCPEDWSRDYILNLMVNRGFITVTDTVAGVLPLECSPFEYNYWKFPINVNIVVPTLEAMTRTIGEDCELLFLEWTDREHFYNFQEVIRIYAERLAAVDASIDVNLFNSRTAFFAEAESKAQAETIRDLYDKVTEGEPLVVGKTDSINGDGLKVFFGNVKQNYISDSLLDAKRSILNELLTYLGINNANTDKKERLISSEVDSNNEELEANAVLWCENLCEQSKKISKMFGIEFSAKWRFDSRTKGGERDDIRRKQETMGDNPPDS